VIVLTITKTGDFSQTGVQLKSLEVEDGSHLKCPNPNATCNLQLGVCDL
jgi:hypothetical protein